MLDLLAPDASSCISEAGNKLVSHTIEAGAINIVVEKTFTTSSSWLCSMWNYFDDKLSNSTFTVDFSYSIVALDQLATPGYEAVNYPIPDHDEFGFFKNEEKILDDNFDSLRKTEKYLLNRWSPNRANNELVYHLSDSFNKSENKLLKEASYEAFKIMNKGFAKAGIPFQLKLEEPSGKNPGDLRNTMLVLVDDPLDNGLLGYGPSVSNPLTGEIVQAHTNMYSGVLKGMTRRVWEAAVDISIDQAKSNFESKQIEMDLDPNALTGLIPDAKITETINKFKGITPEPTADLIKDVKSASENFSEQVLSIAQMMHGHEIEEDKDSHDHDHNHENVFIDRKKALAISKIKNTALIEKQIKAHRLQKQDFKMTDLFRAMNDDNSELGELERKLTKDNARLQLWAENNAYAQEFFPVGGTSKVIYPELSMISGAVNEDGTLKRWNELNPAQKKEARDKILVRTYTSTLIHEIGHNLGLRHNFSGSFDKDNFYSEEEAKQIGLKSAPAYSSIMDYAFSEFNELGAFGKYDKAALKFAYARKVELADGSEAKIGESISDFDKKFQRKEYMFCTDGNAGLSSQCNRFDEGTTFEEIAKFRIKRYEDAYKYRNFRDDRDSFTSYGIYSYLIWRMRELNQIRDIVEEYEHFTTIWEKEAFNNVFKLCTTDPQYKELPVCMMLVDRYNASKIVADFFIKIINTPDHTCAIAQVESPSQVVLFEKLSDIYDEKKFSIDYVTTTCFDPAVEAYLKERYPDYNLLVVGETGKFLNGFKDNDPNYIYSSDRAVRGIWVDKLVATKALFSRRWRNFSTDDEHIALTDIPGVFEKAANSISHFTLGSPLENLVPFKTATGETFTIPYVISKDEKIAPIDDFYTIVKEDLMLPENGRAKLNKTSLSQIKSVGFNYGVDYEDQAKASIDFVTVRKHTSAHSYSKDFSSYRIDNVFYYANESSPIAKTMIDSINAKDYLSEMTEEEVAAIVISINNGEDVELPFDKTFVNEFLEGKLTDDVTAFYREQLQDLDRRYINL